MRQILNVWMRIALNLLGLVLLTFAGASSAAAGTANLKWAPASTTAYGYSGLVSCGASRKVDFKVTFAGSSCSPSFGSNPYRFEFFLYRNGVQVGYLPYQQSSSCSTTAIFYGVDADAGSYSATVNFQKRKMIGWVPVSQDNSGTIIASKNAATPAFAINGQLATTTTSPNVNINISQPIIINASPTMCETTYNIGVQESELNWNRTYKYEWWKWFQGDAPSNINLQQLATTYSNPPDYLGTDLTRLGTPLFGGDLAPGSKRYYRVNLCTVEPAWACATAILRVDP